MSTWNKLQHKPDSLKDMEIFILWTREEFWRRNHEEILLHHINELTAEVKSIIEKWQDIEEFFKQKYN